MTAVPFTVSMFGTLGAADGLVRLDGDALVLEFEVRDNIFGVVRSGPKEVRLPLDFIEAVELHSGWFGTQLTIQSLSLKAMQDVPGSNQGRAVLELSRPARPAAAVLIAQVQERLGDPAAARVTRSRGDAATPLLAGVCAVSLFALLIVLMMLASEPVRLSVAVGPPSEDASEDHDALPVWIEQGLQAADDPDPPLNSSRSIVVSSKQYATVKEAEQDVREQAVQRLLEDVQRVYPDMGPWPLYADRTTLPFLRRHVEELTRETSHLSFRVYRVHQEMELSPMDRQALYRSWQQDVRHQRLRRLAWLFGAVSLTTGVAAAWRTRRREPRTNG